MIKNAKLSGYCFYMNTNIQGDFQICISVPLTLFLLTLDKSVLIKFQNDHILQHNDIINVDKQYLDTFLSQNAAIKRNCGDNFLILPYSKYEGASKQSILFYSQLILMHGCFTDKIAINLKNAIEFNKIYNISCICTCQRQHCSKINCWSSV